jgi:hypothetical protein
MNTKESLTKTQQAFIESYFEDILFGRDDFMAQSDETLVEAISQMDFDDASPAEPGKIRVANNLNALGLLNGYDAHDTQIGRHIYLGFSKKGAQVVVDLMRKAEADGRLPTPKQEGPASLSM